MKNEYLYHFMCKCYIYKTNTNCFSGVKQNKIFNIFLKLYLTMSLILASKVIHNIISNYFSKHELSLHYPKYTLNYLAFMFCLSSRIPLAACPHPNGPLGLNSNPTFSNKVPPDSFAHSEPSLFWLIKYQSQSQPPGTCSNLSFAKELRTSSLKVILRLNGPRELS